MDVVSDGTIQRAFEKISSFCFINPFLTNLCIDPISNTHGITFTPSAQNGTKKLHLGAALPFVVA
jgi:hypothetical protein